MIKVFNKKIIVGIIGIVFLIVLIVLFSKKPRPGSLPLPSPGFTPFSQLNKPLEEFTLPSYTQPPTDNDKVKIASAAKQKLQPFLPIYIENFSTSVEIKTTINIYSNPQDANYLIHFDIYGIDYQSPTTDETTNPNITAFKESFNYAKNLLKQKGINLQDLYFVFGGPEYIQQTAEVWINHFSLL